MRGSFVRLASLVVALVAESAAAGCSDGATASVAIDGGGRDASLVDASPLVDAAPSDGGASDVTPAVCPTDLSGFHPVWHPPTPVHQSRCTPSQISGYFDACVATTHTNATCAAYSPDAGANADCVRCLLSADSDPSYGPLVQSTRMPGLLSVNVAGCIANGIGDVSASGCGAKNQALTECATFACDCPCHDDITCGPVGYGACLAHATSSLCASFQTGARCADALADSGVVDADADAAPLIARCTQPMSFQDYYDSIAPLFCGAASAADAAAD